MKYIPLFILGVVCFGLWLLRSKPRKQSLVLPASWKAQMLRHQNEQNRDGHTMGARSVL